MNIPNSLNLNKYKKNLISVNIISTYAQLTNVINIYFLNFCEHALCDQISSPNDLEQTYIVHQCMRRTGTKVNEYLK